MRRKQLFLNHSSKSGEWRKPPSNGPTAYDVCVTKLHTPYVGKSRNLPQPRYICFFRQHCLPDYHCQHWHDMWMDPTYPSLPRRNRERRKKQHIWQRKGRLVVWECFPSHVCSASQNVFPGNANQSVSAALSNVASLTLHKPRTCLLKKILGASDVFKIIMPKVIVEGRCETCHSFLYSRKVLCNLNLLLKLNFYEVC